VVTPVPTQKIAMIKNRTVFKPALGLMGAIAIIAASPLCYALDPVSVKSLAVHYGGNIQFSYQVSNQTQARGIISVSIGNRGEQPPDPVNPTNAQPELTIYPAGSYWKRMPDQGDSQNVTLRLGGTYNNPPGWSGNISNYEETTNFSVDWNRQVQTDRGILPGQTFNFGVTVPTHDDPRSDYTMSDPAYLTGHFTVGFSHSDAIDEGTPFWNYTGIIVPIDTTPPTLSVTLSPATLWPPNEKLASITATINVRDDYDSSPEIKLESITANEPLDKDDIKDAQFFTDDRQFQLRAEREGKNKAGRIYTVTYSATDASGNKSTASATVTVPHDQDEKERPESKDEQTHHDRR
jgi:hypothetical protein